MNITAQLKLHYSWGLSILKEIYKIYIPLNSFTLNNCVQTDLLLFRKEIIYTHQERHNSHNQNTTGKNFL